YMRRPIRTVLSPLAPAEGERYSLGGGFVLVEVALVDPFSPGLVLTMLCFLISKWAQLVDGYKSFRRKKRKLLPTDCPIRCNCLLTEMPQHLRFNPWILGGYRSPNLSTLQCVQSLTYLHNETVNILTHGLPLLYVLLNYRDLFGGPLQLQSYLTYCHVVACFT